MSDVQAILEQLQARGIGRAGVLGYAFDPDEARDETGQWTEGGASGAAPAAGEEGQDSGSDYRDAVEAWQEEVAEAREEFDQGEHAEWQAAVKAHEDWETAHDEWEDRGIDRDRKKESIDEADPVGKAQTTAETALEDAPEPDWDFNQEDVDAHYREQVEVFANASGPAWDVAFGKEGAARTGLAGLGATDKDLAKFDKLAAKGGAAVRKQSEKYQTAAGKYLDYQVKTDALKAEYDGMEEPEEPDFDAGEPDEPETEKPTLHGVAWEDDEPLPAREDYATQEEYRKAAVAFKDRIKGLFEQARAEYDQEQADYQTARKEYDQAEADYDKAFAKWEKDQTAYEKLGTKVEAMETQAESLAGKMDEERNAVGEVWEESREALAEEQGEIQVKLANRIDAEAEKDEEPEEPDEPGDEPEFEEPDAPDPDEYEPDEEEEPDEESDQEEE